MRIIDLNCNLKYSKYKKLNLRYSKSIDSNKIITGRYSIMIIKLALPSWNSEQIDSIEAEDFAGAQEQVFRTDQMKNTLSETFLSPLQTILCV